MALNFAMNSLFLQQVSIQSNSMKSLENLGGTATDGATWRRPHILRSKTNICVFALLTISVKKGVGCGWGTSQRETPALCFFPRSLVLWLVGCFPQGPIITFCFLDYIWSVFLAMLFPRWASTSPCLIHFCPCCALPHVDLVSSNLAAQISPKSIPMFSIRQAS